MVADSATKGSPRDGIVEEVAADLAWVLNDPGLYHLLVAVRGWTVERRRAWLATTLRHDLLGER